MAADGVSLPTNIAQLGQVAKTQARGQQQAQPVTPFNQQKEAQEELRVQKVKETENADQERIDPDQEREDKRQRRRRRRQRKLAARSRRDRESGDDDGETPPEDQEETVGRLIDLRA